jgi:L-aminopeptidase/D-esterase-like protein
MGILCSLVRRYSWLSTKAQAQRLAQVGHDGLARTIRPVHTAMDGDTLFALATCKNPAAVDVMQLATAAGEVTAMAVINAIRNATSLRMGNTWFPAYKARTTR